MKALYVCAIIFCLAVATSGCSKNFGDVLQKYGYVELTPPSMLVQPGAVISLKSNNPTTVSTLCRLDESLGTKVKITPSQTVDMNLVESLSRTFSIGADYIQLIQADVQFSHVKNVTFNLSNVKVAEISGATVFDNIHNRTRGCQGAIYTYLKNSIDITMVESVLIADVTYDIQVDSKVNASASAKAEILNGLAQKFGLINSSNEKQSATGKGLVCGMRVNSFFAKITDDNKFIEVKYDKTHEQSPDSTDVRTLTVETKELDRQLLEDSERVTVEDTRNFLRRFMKLRIKE